MANPPLTTDAPEGASADTIVVARGELAALSEAERQLALERFRLLRPHLEEGVPLTTVSQEAGLSYRTAVRWVSLYRCFGLAALACKGRADWGKRRGLSPAMQQVVEGLALQKPPLPIAALYRQVVQIARQSVKPERAHLPR